MDHLDSNIARSHRVTGGIGHHRDQVIVADRQRAGIALLIKEAAGGYEGSASDQHWAVLRAHGVELHVTDRRAARSHLRNQVERRGLTHGQAGRRVASGRGRRGRTGQNDAWRGAGHRIHGHSAHRGHRLVARVIQGDRGDFIDTGRSRRKAARIRRGVVDRDRVAVHVERHRRNHTSGIARRRTEVDRVAQGRRGRRRRRAERHNRRGYPHRSGHGHRCRHHPVARAVLRYSCNRVNARRTDTPLGGERIRRRI